MLKKILCIVYSLFVAQKTLQSLLTFDCFGFFLFWLLDYCFSDSMWSHDIIKKVLFITVHNGKFTQLEHMYRMYLVSVTSVYHLSCGLLSHSTKNRNCQRDKHRSIAIHSGLGYLPSRTICSSYIEHSKLLLNPR